jgi:hypothetical protein
MYAVYPPNLHPITSPKINFLPSTFTNIREIIFLSRIDSVPLAFVVAYHLFRWLCEGAHVVLVRVGEKSRARDTKSERRERERLLCTLGVLCEAICWWAALAAAVNRTLWPFSHQALRAKIIWTRAPRCPSSAVSDEREREREAAHLGWNSRSALSRGRWRRRQTPLVAPPHHPTHHDMQMRISHEDRCIFTSQVML